MAPTPFFEASFDARSRIRTHIELFNKLHAIITAFCEPKTWTLRWPEPYDVRLDYGRELTDTTLIALINTRQVCALTGEVLHVEVYYESLDQESTSSVHGQVIIACRHYPTGVENIDGILAKRTPLYPDELTAQIRPLISSLQDAA
jgi:hypothetical protein